MITNWDYTKKKQASQKGWELHFTNLTTGKFWHNEWKSIILSLKFATVETHFEMYLLPSVNVI